MALYQLHVTGRISEAEFRANEALGQRERRIATASSRQPDMVGLLRRDSWTPADARRALDALPGYPPLPPFDGQVYDERVMGQVLLLAGRVDEAIPHLRDAPSARASVWSTSRRTSSPPEMLGEALEQKRDPRVRAMHTRRS